MKLQDPDHLEKIKRFYAAISTVNLMDYPYFILIYRLFDLCRKEIFQQQRYGGPFKRVLDVGCGTGYHTLRAAQFCQEIVGLDVSPESIELARKQVKELGLSNVSFVCSDINHNPFPNEAFDCVIAYGDVIGHIPDYRMALSEISRITIPGALLSFDCDNKWYLGLIREWEELRRAFERPSEGHTRTWHFRGQQMDFNTFTQRELKELLSANRFKVLRTYGFDFFPFAIRAPERLQFSESIGWRERSVMFLNRMDIALRRFWPINRLGYTKVIFARKI
ncbi:MAG TPA: class I SAM-dependent methyltransferase [Nitrospiria bacterium]|nr:class I SAM-dependent methyltransferase [Nitrospiria bacterium]